MNFGEAKQKIKNLGFETASTMQSFSELVSDAINNAMVEVGHFAPPMSNYTFVQDGTESDFVEIDLVENCTNFYDLVEIKRLYNGEYKRFSNYEYEENRYIVLNQKYPGTFKIIYEQEIIPTTSTTDDDTELSVEYKAEDAFILLSAYYVWQDDEPEKAINYYNQYETLKAEYISLQQQQTDKGYYSGGVTL